MREVVGRVDAPGVARARVRGVRDAVEHRVAQVDVRGGHVDPGAQDPRPVRELAAPHPLEQVEALVDRPVAPRAVAAGLGERSAVGADLVGRQVVDVGVAGPDQLDRPVVELLEVVRGEGTGRSPQSKPSQRTSASMASMYSCSSLTGFVSSKRRWHRPPNSAGDAEVEADRLGVADVQVAVRLGREAGHDRRRPARLAGRRRRCRG